jgi:flavin-dependent thymidylate synthase
MTEQEWLKEHRAGRNYRLHAQLRVPKYSRSAQDPSSLLSDRGFNSHALNDGRHVSPYDNGRVVVGTDELKVRLLQGVDEASFAKVLSRALRATTGVAPDEPIDVTDVDEMLRGGLQAALETQTIVFEVTGASRALTHQLVRSRKAGFHQQSQRATWYGDRPEFRMPMSVFRQSQPTEEKKEAYRSFAIGGAEDASLLRSVRASWDIALLACWEAYKAACDAGVSYQDARYILPEGTTNYILCEYTVREFINVFAYRGCSMFLWEMVDCMRKMRRVLIDAHPFLQPHVKISCEKSGAECSRCKGSGYIHARDGVAATTEEIKDCREADDPQYEVITCWECGGQGGGRKCTFQGWENVEGVCDFPWARQDNRVFLPNPKNRIGE